MTGSLDEMTSSDFFQWLADLFARAGSTLAAFFQKLGMGITSAFHWLGMNISSAFHSLGLGRLFNALVVLGHAIVIGLAFLLALAMIIMSVTFLLMITATLISYTRRQARQRASVRIRLTMDSRLPDESLLRQYTVPTAVRPAAMQPPQYPARQQGAQSQWMQAVHELHSQAERRRRAENRREQLQPRWGQRNALVHTFLKLHERAYGDDDDCVICRESLDDPPKRIGKLGCGHVYHLDCIAEWFSRCDELSCPMCRAVFSDTEYGYTRPSSYGTV